MSGLRVLRTTLTIAVAALITFSAPASAQERIQIVTTTSDLRSLAEAVGGDRVAVTSLVPPNLDPEEYQPRPQDLTRLKGTRLVVRVGLDFDLWFDRLLAQAGGGVQRGGPGYVDASFAIAPLEVRGVTVGPGDGHAHGSGNPHYWLDPKNAEIITGNILEGLMRVDPENAPLYEANRLASSSGSTASSRSGRRRLRRSTACRWSPTTTAGPISRDASGSTSSASSSRSRACRRRRFISRR